MQKKLFSEHMLSTDSEMEKLLMDRHNSQDNLDDEHLPEQDPDPDIEMHVEDVAVLEIEAEDNKEAPTHIAVWLELVEYDEPIYFGNKSHCKPGTLAILTLIGMKNSLNLIFVVCS